VKRRLQKSQLFELFWCIYLRVNAVTKISIHDSHNLIMQHFDACSA